MHEYRKIVNALIDKHFPILRGKNITILELPESKVYSGYAFKRPFVRVIKLHPRVRTYSSAFLKALLVHELCHLEAWEKHPFHFYFIRGIKLILRKNRIKDEHETDKCVIRKGYARALYAQRASRWSERKDKRVRKLLELYFTPEEIKSYAKKIGKW